MSAISSASRRITGASSKNGGSGEEDVTKDGKDGEDLIDPEDGRDSDNDQKEEEEDSSDDFSDAEVPDDDDFGQIFGDEAVEWGAYSFRSFLAHLMKRCIVTHLQLTARHRCHL